MNILGLVLAIIFCGFTLPPQEKPPAINLPPRSPHAQTGFVFARSIAELPLPEREEKILAEVKAGNVPPFWRNFVPVETSSGDRNLRAIFFVSPDYLAIGSNDDYFLAPLTPHTAQCVADLVDCSLPTPKMVDDIYAAASIKLVPSPIPPSPAMTTVPVFLQHNATIAGQRSKNQPPGLLVAGHKKDVVIAKKLFDNPGKVAIYGWHRPDGKPIQPLYTGHTETWADYSHGVRLVRNRMIVNGQATSLAEVLADPQRASLLSNEGVLLKTRYEPTPKPKTAAPTPASSTETFETLRLDRGVRVVIDRPKSFDAKARPTLLVFFALPNGGTIEQAIGKKPEPGDDWHFDIQHIGAQTRFLRERIADRQIVVAYLENDLKSWPAWRKKHGNEAIPAILDAVRTKFLGDRTRIALTGHSGGGSLIFGYVNVLDAIPDEIERIAFLDANYAYETARHRDKLIVWLKASNQHFLGVFAYNDAVALLNGKTFVSASGGTWGRSRAMLHDLGDTFPLVISPTEADNTNRHSALSGRLMFLLTENPQKKILHTVLVERNGFIEALLFGTRLAGRGYTYLGNRAYGAFITGNPAIASP